jgi:methylated-DNA-[protein]-cysteine S-methyltransferase
VEFVEVKMASYYYGFVESPLGRILLVSTESALTHVHFVGEKYYPSVDAAWREALTAPIQAAMRQLEEYFAGKRERFELPLAPHGTPFQREVWKAISGVPFGRTITYGELARRIGSPQAVRAAGAATGRNPIGIVVPCHRIVGSNGSLTGYAGGLARKKALLELEAGSAADFALRRVEA